jgi:uncharacterized protein YcbX
MFVKELWRYPIKSVAGERVNEAELSTLGIPGDRTVLVLRRGRVATSRTYPKLLGLHGTLGADGVPRIDGHAWDSPEALALVRNAVGSDAEMIRYEGEERFDILPLLVATDGAIAHQGIDGRRLRPNIIVGGVEGLAERDWPGRTLRIGDAVLRPEQLRGRCIMTTYDPDTLEQDREVLRRIGRELGGTMGLDTAVERGGLIRVGDAVEVG